MTAAILLVDDEPYVSHAIRRALRSHDYRFLSATSADDALAILRHEAVDVIVSDEEMPGTPGSVLLTQVRQQFPDVERLILSGHASVEATIRAINEAQVFKFLTKPCEPDELACSIDQALAAREVRRALEARSAPDPEVHRQFTEALDHLKVWFQPIFGVGSGVVAHEVLMRSMHEALPSPIDMIAAATRLDRQYDLDRRVRTLVAERVGSATPPTRLFINLLPSSLSDDQLVDDDPLLPFSEHVVLEVTERASLASVGDVANRIEGLRRVGYRIALDDLGAGYAGLSSFALLSPDIVKFDMDMVRNVDQSDTQIQLIRSMLRVCGDLGVETVAEGIETVAEMKTLTALGCTYYQGFLLGKPAPDFTS